MDRIDFVKSIKYDNIENTIRMFFDQIMALNNLIDNRFCNLDISTETEVENIPSIRFTILTDSEEEANAAVSILNDRIIPIYGHNYTAQLSKNNKSLIVELSEEVSG